VFQFLTELTKLFQKSKSSGSLNITMKKCAYFPSDIWLRSFSNYRY